MNTVIFSPSEGLSGNHPSGHASVFSLLLIVLLLRYICNGLGFDRCWANSAIIGVTAIIWSVLTVTVNLIIWFKI